jgi:hypothetical protein
MACHQTLFVQMHIGTDLVSIQKWPFSAISASIGGIVCSRRESGTRNPLISPAYEIGIFDLLLRKIAHF